MNRASIVEYLAVAERHVAQGEDNIARQREIIAEFQQGGHDTTAALDLLRVYEQTQAANFVGRDRYRAELAKV